MFHWLKKHTRWGLEVPDTTPIEVPLRDRPLTLAEQIVRFTSNSQHMAELSKRGVDTFEEADDFDTGDMEPDDFHSPYEDRFVGEEIPLNRVQTRLDEQKAGMVEDMPFERQSRANDHLRSFREKSKNKEADLLTASKENKDVKPVS